MCMFVAKKKNTSKCASGLNSISPYVWHIDIEFQDSNFPRCLVYLVENWDFKRKRRWKKRQFSIEIQYQHHLSTCAVWLEPDRKTLIKNPIVTRSVTRGTIFDELHFTSSLRWMLFLQVFYSWLNDFSTGKLRLMTLMLFIFKELRYGVFANV